MYVFFAQMERTQAYKVYIYAGTFLLSFAISRILVIHKHNKCRTKNKLAPRALT